MTAVFIMPRTISHGSLWVCDACVKHRCSHVTRGIFVLRAPMHGTQGTFRGSCMHSTASHADHAFMRLTMCHPISRAHTHERSLVGVSKMQVCLRADSTVAVHFHDDASGHKHFLPSIDTGVNRKKGPARMPYHYVAQ